jgi:hypothetical protein
MVTAPFPATKTHYYFVADAQPGALLTQISYQGRKGADKELELALLSEDGRVTESYWIHGSDLVEEATRSFPIDKQGRQVLRIAVQGPETGKFRVEFGGPALNTIEPKAPQLHNGFSRSVFSPTLVDAQGVITGPLPGTESTTVYYFTVNTQAGELLTQISYKGRDGADKELTFAEWYWIHGSDAQDEATRSFSVDTAGRKLLRVDVAGPTTGAFRIELGGSAFAGEARPKKSPVTTSQTDL